MAIEFRDVSAAALQQLSASVPDGVIVGLVGDDPAALSAVGRLATGVDFPDAGEVLSSEPRRYLGPVDALQLAPAGTVVLDQTLARQGAVVRAWARAGLERLRRAGASIFIASQEPELLSTLCDEVWWIDAGRLAARGEPAEVLEAYARHAAARIREWGKTVAQAETGLAPSLRRGDGRAELVAIETLDAAGQPTSVWQSGEPAAICVTVRFAAAVDDPVVGIMIRTRVGFEVYGTNTELEKVRLGPVPAGETRRVRFAFACHLCPQDYTLTAASHDPDGIWHDWMEDALAFTVAGTRYTAGVANLHASVTVDASGRS
ncbi:MAG: Wzt carbohydrate-binding domain-containing protein [Bryobacterales bacterium]|nr:Wzt carbohydrate-binding domain-containing protein [Bryobacterales bacterium]